MNLEQRDIIATRVLTLVQDLPDAPEFVNVIIYSATQEQQDWKIDYEIIGLPSLGHIYRHIAIQVDTAGALEQALEKIAMRLLSSIEYKQEKLYWLAPKDHCGFRIPKGFE